MGLSNGGEAGKDADEQSRTKLESFFSSQTVNTIEESIKSARQDVPMSESTNGDADGSSVSAGLRPPRPSREFRRASAVSSITTVRALTLVFRLVPLTLLLYSSLKLTSSLSNGSTAGFHLTCGYKILPLDLS